MSQLIAFLCLWTLAGLCLAAYLYSPKQPPSTMTARVVDIDNLTHSIVFAFQAGEWVEQGRWVK